MSKALPFKSGHFRRTYADEFRLIETRFAKLCAVAFALFLLTFPLYASSFHVDLAAQVFLAAIGALALIVVGPKDLPGMLRSLGQHVGRLRGMARDFQRAMNDAARDADLGNLFYIGAKWQINF